MDASKSTASRGQNSSDAECSEQQVRGQLGRSLLQNAADDLHEAARADDLGRVRILVGDAQPLIAVGLDLLEDAEGN